MKLFRVAVAGLVVAFALPAEVHADITWVGGFFVVDGVGGYAQAASSITAERVDETDALYAYALITVEGQFADDEEVTCTHGGSWPYSCAALVRVENLTVGCEYCGSGEVKALRYNPNQTAFQSEWGEFCDTYLCLTGGCDGGILPGQ